MPARKIPTGEPFLVTFNDGQADRILWGMSADAVADHVVRGHPAGRLVKKTALGGTPRDSFKVKPLPAKHPFRKVWDSPPPKSGKAKAKAKAEKGGA